MSEQGGQVGKVGEVGKVGQADKVGKVGQGEIKVLNSGEISKFSI